MNEFLQGVDWEASIGSAAVLVGIIISIFQLRTFKPRMRAKIRTDLEILGKIEKSDPNYGIVKKSIDSMITEFYLNGDKFKVYSWPLLIFGMAWSAIFIFWTLRILDNGFTPWIFATGFAGIYGLIFIVNSFNKAIRAGLSEAMLMQSDVATTQENKKPRDVISDQKGKV